jgi:hypothetical protein
METTEDKTKRKIIKEISNPIYRYSNVIFFNVYFPDILTIGSNIKKKLARKFNTRTFWYTRTKNIDSFQLTNEINTKQIVQPYIQFFTQDPIDIEQYEDYIHKHFNLEVKVRCQEFFELRKSQWCNTLKREKLINLDKFNTKNNQYRRWSVTNKNNYTQIKEDDIEFLAPQDIKLPF